jgi:hypothetical protein
LIAAFFCGVVLATSFIIYAFLWIPTLLPAFLATVIGIYLATDFYDLTCTLIDFGLTVLAVTTAVLTFKIFFTGETFKVLAFLTVLSFCGIPLAYLAGTTLNDFLLGQVPVFGIF